MKTILLVEDSRFMRMAHQRSLARAGYTVVTAVDGEEALRMAVEGTPDLILLDMLLPKVSGDEVLRTLRKNARTDRVPIVVISSLPQSNEPRLKKEGATAYFDKSKLGLECESDSLVQIVKKILGEETKANCAAAAAKGHA